LEGHHSVADLGTVRSDTQKDITIMLLAMIGASGRDHDDLMGENARLRSEIADLRRREDDCQEALNEIRSNLRTLLTPMSGYLQVIAGHRPMIRGQPVDAVIREQVLPRVHDLADAVDRLSRPPLCRTRHRG
jgi:hypothetical protein